MTEAKTQGFRVLPSYYEAIRDLPDPERLQIYDAIFDFGFGNEVKALPPLLNGYFMLMAPSLEKSVKFEEKQIANGKKGGRPQKPRQNPDETQTEPKENVAVAVDFALAPAFERAIDGRAAPPTEEDVFEYCQDSGLSVDAGRFVDYYASRGWKMGSEPMQDWRAAVRNWARRDLQETERRGTKKQGALGPTVCQTVDSGLGYGIPVDLGDLDKLIAAGEVPGFGNDVEGSR